MNPCVREKSSSDRENRLGAELSFDYVVCQPGRHQIDYLGSCLMTLGIGTLIFTFVQARMLGLVAWIAGFCTSIFR